MPKTQRKTRTKNHAGSKKADATTAASGTKTDSDCLPSAVCLDQCELLQAVPHVECTHFHQFVLLQPNQTPPGKNGASPPATAATFPGQLAWKNPDFAQRIKDASRQIVKNIHLKMPSLQPTVVGGGKSSRKPAAARDQRANLSKVDIQNLGQVMRGQYVQKQYGLSSPTQPRSSIMHANMPPGFEPPIDLGEALAPVLGAIKDAAALAAAAQPRATWALALDYKQCWKSRGYVRGRLVRSLPLTPGEQLEIVIKTWNKQTQTSSQVESVEKNVSNELTGEEKWMLASKMTFSDQTNAGINPSAGAKAGVGLPIESVKIAGGGNLGLSGNLSNAVTHATENGMDYTQSSMLKAAESLKSVRTNSVELISETGTETTSKQVIANTNRCRTLTYHYFEVLENFHVTTGLNAVELCLLLPLPLPEITPEWVLCHECYLRKMLPCDVYYAGFPAAKQLLAWQNADALAPGGNWWAAGEPADPSSTVDLSGLNSAVQNVLAHWATVKNATILVQPNSPAGADAVWNAAGASLNQAAQGLQTMADGARNGDPAEVAKGFAQVAESPANVAHAFGF